MRAYIFLTILTCILECQYSKGSINFDKQFSIFMETIKSTAINRRNCKYYQLRMQKQPEMFQKTAKTALNNYLNIMFISMFILFASKFCQTLIFSFKS